MYKVSLEYTVTPESRKVIKDVFTKESFHKDIKANLKGFSLLKCIILRNRKRKERNLNTSYVKIHVHMKILK